ncbi:MAG: right-handed parallel beta-helix repeat-containing protein [Verrucomicrobiota bacterium]|jgi:hypothetical protein
MKPEVLKALAITTLCLIAQIPFAGATTYYLSTSQGSDSNSGTNSNSPWQTISNIVSTERSIKPGDSLLFKAGDAFDGPLYISVQFPATSNAPVTIDRYGTGANPIVYGDHETATWSATSGFTGIYQTPSLGPSWAINVSKVYDTNGFKYYQMVQGTNTCTNYLNSFTNGCWGKSSDGTTIYVKTLDNNPPPQMRLMEWACVCTPSYYNVQNLEICYGGKGIEPGSYGIVRSNYIHDCYAAGIGLYQIWGCQVCGNIVTRDASTEVYLEAGGNHWIHHNTISCTGTDYNNTATIIAENCVVSNTENANIGMQQGTNNLIEYNVLSYALSDFCDWWLEANAEVRYNYGFHAGMATAVNGTGIKFHHNIFDLDGVGSGILGYHIYDPTNSPSPDTGPVLIYNNVVYNFKTTGLYTAGNGASGTIFRNNIVCTPSKYSVMAAASLSTGADSDYNVFYSTGTPMFWILNGGAHQTSLAAWRTQSGQDAHSIYANPQFVSANPVVAADFQLKPTSPCIDAGQNLKLAGLLARNAQYQDYLGTSIPQGSGPDIGAYEMPVLSPATGLHIIK